MFPSTFRRLEVFVAVVDAGSFVAAAERLGISHPSVSNHIRALERHVRCELFHRRRGAVSSLTEQGRRLYERGIELLQQAELLSEDLALDRRQIKRKPLQISSQRSIAGGWLCRPFASFAKDHPEIEFIVEIGRYEGVIADVLEGRADIGFLLSYGAILDLPAERIGQETLSFYASPSHPLAKRTNISPAELASHPFITTKRDSRFGQVMHNLMASAGVADYQVAHQIQEGVIVQELAMLGLGIFCGLDRQAAPHLHAGTLTRLAVEAPPLAMDVHCVLSPRKRQEKAASQLMMFLRSYYTPRPR